MTLWRACAEAFLMAMLVVFTATMVGYMTFAPFIARGDIDSVVFGAWGMVMTGMFIYLLLLAKQYYLIVLYYWKSRAVKKIIVWSLLVPGCTSIITIFFVFMPLWMSYPALIVIAFLTLYQAISLGSKTSDTHSLNEEESV